MLTISCTGLLFRLWAEAEAEKRAEAEAERRVLVGRAKGPGGQGEAEGSQADVARVPLFGTAQLRRQMRNRLLLSPHLVSIGA